MHTPGYTLDPTYQALSELCEKAGLRLQYADIPRSFYARSRDTLIQMPSDGNRFQSSEHAAIVLGHELAHLLVNAQYPPQDEDQPLNLPLHMLVESECDRLGAYLYLLAGRIAAHTQAQAAEAEPETEA